MKRNNIKIFSITLVLSFFILSCSSSKNASGKVFRSNVEASYYHDKFNGKKTASGEKFSNSKLTAAHRTLPFGTNVKVTNLANDKSVIVEVNDRGPFKKSREIDLSKSAFMEITDNKNHGTLRVKIEVIK